MTPLVSILIPTRRRTVKLHNCLRSIYETASSSNFDIWLKVDDDDEPTIRFLNEFSAFNPNVHYIIGPRMSGYNSVDLFYSQLSDKAQGAWVWLLNDDATIVGSGWDGMLKEVPLQGVMVQPYCYRLNQSLYCLRDWTAFPVVPNGCWNKLGSELIPRPADSGLYELLVKRNGWTPHHLPGITVSHQREVDETLTADRL